MLKSPRFREHALTRDMRALDSRGRIGYAVRVLEEVGDEVDLDLVELLLAQLEPASRKELFSCLPGTANGAYLKARITAGDEAVQAWQNFFTFAADRTPLNLLSYARALAECGKRDEAIQELRLALSQQPPYAFFPRAEKLVNRLRTGAGGNGRSQPSEQRQRVLVDFRSGFVRSWPVPAGNQNRRPLSHRVPRRPGRHG